MSAITLSTADFPPTCSDVPEAINRPVLPIPGGLCRCASGRRFYVALSVDLNRRAFESGTKDFSPFIFKIGSMKSCRDRISSLNEFRKPGSRGDAEIYGEPAYAGATDWRILDCRTVPIERYDDRIFKKWLRVNFEDQYVRVLEPITFAKIKGLSPTHRFRDLCVMSEDFVRRRSGTRINNPLNEHMIGVVAKAIIEIAGQFQGWLYNHNVDPSAIG